MSVISSSQADMEHRTSQFLTANPCEQIHTHLLRGPACSDFALGFGKSHFLIIIYIHIKMMPETCVAFLLWGPAGNIIRNSCTMSKENPIPALVKTTATYTTIF